MERVVAAVKRMRPSVDVSNVEKYREGANEPQRLFRVSSSKLLSSASWWKVRVQVEVGSLVLVVFEPLPPNVRGPA